MGWKHPEHKSTDSEDVNPDGPSTSTGCSTENRTSRGKLTRDVSVDEYRVLREKLQREKAVIEETQQELLLRLPKAKCGGGQWHWPDSKKHSIYIRPSKFSTFGYRKVKYTCGHHCFTLLRVCADEDDLLPSESEGTSDSEPEVALTGKSAVDRTRRPQTAKRGRRQASNH